jgi:hypothetical protein
LFGPQERALLSYPTGALSDRIPPRHVYAIGLACFAVGYLGLGPSAVDLEFRALGRRPGAGYRGVLSVVLDPVLYADSDVTKGLTEGHRMPAQTTARPESGAARVLGLDFPRGGHQPSVIRWVAATAAAVVGSVAVCAALAAAGSAVFPATSGYEHFRFADYAKLTVIGVVLASLAWPVVTWFSTRAWKPFLVLTVLVTLGGLAPDAWILYKGQPADAVGVLVLMHVALALITYPALVLIAPQAGRKGKVADMGSRPPA